jgi:hypothetical protein
MEEARPHVLSPGLVWLDERKNGSGLNGDEIRVGSAEANDSFLLLPRASFSRGGGFSRLSSSPMSLDNWGEYFSLPGGLVISCSAFRDVRTFRSTLEDFAGVKNFLKRLGVIVGGLIGFLEMPFSTEQLGVGDEAGHIGRDSAIAIENLVDT